jgi:hypothetical protein
MKYTILTVLLAMTNLCRGQGNSSEGPAENPKIFPEIRYSISLENNVMTDSSTNILHGRLKNTSIYTLKFVLIEFPPVLSNIAMEQEYRLENGSPKNIPVVLKGGDVYEFTEHFAIGRPLVQNDVVWPTDMVVPTRTNKDSNLTVELEGNYHLTVFTGLETLDQKYFKLLNSDTFDLKVTK